MYVYTYTLYILKCNTKFNATCNYKFYNYISLREMVKKNQLVRWYTNTQLQEINVSFPFRWIIINHLSFLSFLPSFSLASSSISLQNRLIPLQIFQYRQDKR
jgi:hypothetical protein